MPAFIALGIVALIFGMVYAVEVFLLRRRPADITSDMVAGGLWPWNWLGEIASFLVKMFSPRRSRIKRDLP